MNLRIIWPGKTLNPNMRGLQEEYLRKISRLGKCQVLQTREAKGISEKYADRIMEIEADGMGKHIEDAYLICLSDRGREMTSEKFARFLEKTALDRPYPIVFAVGGFLGLADRIMKRADTLLSLSRMTFSHELSRVVLLEQIYRALSILRGIQYAK